MVPLHFQPPKELDGKKESFDEFNYNLKADFDLMNPAVKVVLKKVEENLHVEINDNAFNDEQDNHRAGLVEMASQLPWILVSLCSGQASTLHRRDSDEWLRELGAIGDEVQDSSFKSDGGGLSNITNPNFTETNFEDILSMWDGEILRYENETTSKLPEDLRIAIMMNETNGALQDYLCSSAGSTRLYSSVKIAIASCFRSKHIFQGQASGGATPMEADAFWKGGGKYKKGTGKGYDKGTSKGMTRHGKGKGKKGKGNMKRGNSVEAEKCLRCGGAGHRNGAMRDALDNALFRLHRRRQRLQRELD